MNPRAELETIRERIERLDDINRADISFQMAAHYALDTILQEDLPRLLDAVEKVLELHKSTGQGCWECYTDDYPCPTVQAINTALEVA